MLQLPWSCVPTLPKTLGALAAIPKIVRARPYSTMRAVVIRGGTQAAVDGKRAVPPLRDECLLVKPVAVALNPTDWRSTRGGRAKDGCIVGCDYAGVVAAVGSGVTKRWAVGDRVFGCSHGANLVNPDDGVFADCAAVVGDLQMRVPEGMDYEQAATVGLGSITVGQGLFQKALKLQLPSATAAAEANGIPVLIYGGATATGALAIQFAKQAGYTVVTTCSPRNFAYVEGLGADLVVDYNEAGAASRIRAFTENRLRHAWDTVSVEQSAAFCAEALTDDAKLAPVYGAILGVQCPRDDVESVSTVMYTVFGRSFRFGPVEMPASQDDYEFGKMFFDLTEKLLAQGRLRPHTHRTGKQGLEGVLQGLDDLEHGKIRGEKLVYRVADTPAYT